MDEIKAVRGTSDILPPDSYLWQFVERVCKVVAECACYLEIRTPLFEETALFERSVGETTDIVEKQMYTFTTPGGERITLRPEMTASVMRAYLENSLHKKGAFRKFYYIGPAFRYERPQAGRSRQFHQFGLEAIGSKDPQLDAETIILAWDILSSCGIPDLMLRLNSIGCPECRPKYREAIQTKIESSLELLCDDCRVRAKRNVFRVLDCKQMVCRKVAEELPTTENYLCPNCKDHFAKVKSLVAKHIPNWKLDPHLVRGLDYYTNTVYELTTKSLGAQDSVGGGGRYDNLIRDLGGPDIPAVGFALGLDRIVFALSSIREEERDKAVFEFYSSRRKWLLSLEPLHEIFLQPSPAIFLATVSDEERRFTFDLMVRLRRAGVAAEMDFEGRSLKAQLRQADKLNAKFVAVIGPEEIQNSFLKLRNMATGVEEKVPIDATLPLHIVKIPAT